METHKMQTSDRTQDNIERIAQLFGVQRPAITKHLKNIFESGELDEKVVSSILEHTTQHGAIEGKEQVKVKYYNLDAIISVGYRINSRQATQFRIWQILICYSLFRELFMRVLSLLLPKSLFLPTIETSNTPPS